MKTIRFNTSRSYTANGQRIVATLYDDGTVTFMDHDRMVCGEYREDDPSNFNQSSVLLRYDRVMYSNTLKAWEDGMTRNGVNRLLR